MPFQKGKSGNPKGRPKQTEKQKQEREEFLQLLTQSTVPALESLLQIANDRRHKDRFQACKFIIEKAYGKNIAMIADNIAMEPIYIEIQPYHKEKEDEEWSKAIEEAKKYD